MLRGIQQSHVDIVQAIGRAMRVSPGKTCGYVFVPLHVDKKAGETIEEALMRTNFETLAEVVNAVREHDSDITSTIRAVQIARGAKESTSQPIKDLLDRLIVVGGRSVRLVRLRNGSQLSLSIVWGRLGINVMAP